MSPRDLSQADGDEVARRWDDYLVARTRAERSQDINDGIAAGRAWAAWLDPFTPERAVTAQPEARS